MISKNRTCLLIPCPVTQAKNIGSLKCRGVLLTSRENRVRVVRSVALPKVISANIAWLSELLWVQSHDQGLLIGYVNLIIHHLYLVIVSTLFHLSPWQNAWCWQSKRWNIVGGYAQWTSPPWRKVLFATKEACVNLTELLFKEADFLCKRSMLTWPFVNKHTFWVKKQYFCGILLLFLLHFLLRSNVCTFCKEA